MVRNIATNRYTTASTSPFYRRAARPIRPAPTIPIPVTIGAIPELATLAALDEALEAELVTLEARDEASLDALLN